MRINKMTATFGRLKSQSLEPGGGLTVINAPNESGKSTWCAFIRAMLYGIDTSERERGGVKPDKTKYAPWGGEPMQGRMELTHEGHDITLTRLSGKAPMTELTAVYSGTNEPVPGLTVTNLGETLTGMPKGVFERSVFIRQAGLSVSTNPDLEKRIAAIVSTGEDDVSYTQADEQLRAWQRKRKYNRRGSIPETEAEIARLEQELNGVREAVQEVTQLESAIPHYEQRVAELEAQMLISRKEQRKSALAQMSERTKLLREQEQQTEQAKTATAERLGTLRSSQFGQRLPDEVTREAQSDYGKAATLMNESGSTKIPIAGIVLAVLAIAALVAGAVLLNYIALALGAVMLVGAVALFFLYRKSLTTAAEAGAQLDEILQKYRASAPEDILTAAKAHLQAYEDWQSATNHEQEQSVRLEAVRARQKETDSQLLSGLDFSDSGSGRAAELTREIKSVSAKLAAAREAAAQSRGRLESLGDPLLIESKLSELNELHGELEEQYCALALAIATLGEVNAEIQTRFSPALGRRATELMHLMTGGRYDELTLDRKLAASARLAGDLSAHETALLSAGALDQLYLALRIAICELALPEGETCPMILDDALANFDDDRMRAALDLLLELSHERQIILFTCHSREAEYLAEKQNAKIIDF